MLSTVKERLLEHSKTHQFLLRFLALSNWFEAWWVSIARHGVLSALEVKNTAITAVAFKAALKVNVKNYGTDWFFNFFINESWIGHICKLCELDVFLSLHHWLFKHCQVFLMAAVQRLVRNALRCRNVEVPIGLQVRKAGKGWKKKIPLHIKVRNHRWDMVGW